MDEITTAAELRELLGEPSAAAANKERNTLDDVHRQWLAASPFCLVATSATDGSCDVSPKGDPPGFTLVLDEQTIAVPERAGTAGRMNSTTSSATRTWAWSTCCPAAATRCGSTAAPG